MAIRFSRGNPTLSSSSIQSTIGKTFNPIDRAQQFGRRAVNKTAQGKTNFHTPPNVTSQEHKFKSASEPANMKEFSDNLEKERHTSAATTDAYNQTLTTRRQSAKQQRYEQELSAWEDRQKQRNIEQYEAANRQLDKLGRGVSIEGTGPGSQGELSPVMQRKSGNTIVDAAMSLVGTRYSYGGGGHSRRTSYGTARGDQNVVGVDCSGLTSYAYYQAGINIPRHSRSQVSAGHKTSIRNAKPGDVIGWYNRDGSIMAHVGIYAGNGKIIEANGPMGRVVHRDLWSAGSAFAVSLG